MIIVLHIIHHKNISIMKKLILAAAFTVAGMMTVSAQTTPQKRDTVRQDTTRHHNNMKQDNTNNNWDKSKTDTTSLKNKDAVKSDRKMKKKDK